MTNCPRISVITVVFNSKDSIEQTILSVLNQTYKNIEYIVIDGGSLDGTIEIVKKYLDKISKFITETDNGIYDAMNKGISLSSGEWIIFMNAGDRFVSNDVLEKIFSYNTSDYDVIYSDTLINTDYIYKCDISKNNIIHQSVIYRKKLHDEVGLYLVKKGVLLSEYIFFNLIKDKRWYKTDVIISDYNTKGVSNKNIFKHIKQKIGVDLLFNNISVINAIIKLILFPVYRIVKKLILKR